GPPVVLRDWHRTSHPRRARASVFRSLPRGASSRQRPARRARGLRTRPAHLLPGEPCFQAVLKLASPLRACPLRTLPAATRPSASARHWQGVRILAARILEAASLEVLHALPHLPRPHP